MPFQPGRLLPGRPECGPEGFFIKACPAANQLPSAAGCINRHGRDAKGNMGMRVRFVLAAVLAASLAGCGSSGPAPLPVACPNPGLLADGADLTRYRPGPVRDLTTLEFDARLAGINGSCRPGRGDRSIDITLTTSFSVERGAAAQGRTVDLPWFVAVVGPDEQVLSRQVFVERVAFGRNETRTTGSSEPVNLSLPVGEDRRARDYRIFVSFELTPEDLALNRRRGPR
jgi:hypothetical protein